MPKNNKGITIVELCVAIAVISVISVIIVSFTLLAQNDSEIIIKDTECRAELESVKQAFFDWVIYYDKPASGTKYVLKNGNILDTENSSTPFYFSNSSLFYFYENQLNELKTTYIKSIDFGISETNNGKLLISCNVSYECNNKILNIRFLRTASFNGNYEVVQ